MTTQSPDQSNSQSPAPSKEMEDFIQSLAARTLREMMAEAIPVGVLVKAFHSLAAELGKEREAEAPKPSAFQSWDSVRERYYAEKDGEEYQTAVYIERLKAEIDEKGERIDTLKRELAGAREKLALLDQTNAELNEELSAFNRAFETCEHGHGLQTECYGCQRDTARKESEDLRAQLLALSASCQRQKEALKNLCDALSGRVHSQPAIRYLYEGRQALAETPDVSLLERYQYLATVAKEVVEADDAAIAEIEAMGVEPETRLTSKLKYALNALSTLQLDHQK